MEIGGDQRTKEDIAKYGCSVMHVFDTDGDLPSFAYSIGIQQETGAPEVVVIGLKRPMALSVVKSKNRVRTGERFEIGKYYDGFLGALRFVSGRSHIRPMRTILAKILISMAVGTFKSCRSSIRRPKGYGPGPTMPQNLSSNGSLCLRRWTRAVPFNSPIETDPQPLKAASPPNVVVQSSSR